MCALGLQAVRNRPLWWLRVGCPKLYKYAPLKARASRGISSNAPRRNLRAHMLRPSLMGFWNALKFLRGSFWWQVD